MFIGRTQRSSHSLTSLAFPRVCSLFKRWTTPTSPSSTSCSGRTRSRTTAATETCPSV
jgi:hypothetical protein